MIRPSELASFYAVATSRDAAAIRVLSDTILIKPRWDEDDDKIVSRIVSNSFTPTDVLMDMSEHSASHNLVTSFLRNKNLPEEVWVELALSPYPKTRKAVLRHSNTPEAALIKAFSLWNELGEIDQKHLLSHPRFPKHLYEILVRSQNYVASGHIASDPETPAELLRWLSFHPHHMVRQHVTANPNTAVSALESLAYRETYPPMRFHVVNRLRKEFEPYKSMPVEWLDEIFGLTNPKFVS